MNQCTQCSKSFNIRTEDNTFYARINVPLPTLCPDCRQQRRLAWRNEHSLYQRNCDLCKQPVIAMYPSSVTFPVYCYNCYHSSNWDPLQYGRSIDFSKSFFEQFADLQNSVPHIALLASNNENSTYINMSGYNKDCYLLYAGDYNERVLYATQAIKSTDCVDVLNCIESEKCYECVDIEKCYNTWYSVNCKNCIDCMFLYDCRGCSDVLFSTNLRNKQYYIFNEPYSPAAYAEKKKEILNRLKSGELPELLKEFNALYMKAVHRPLEELHNENSIGDGLYYSNTAYYCFDGNRLDNCSYVTTGYEVKDAWDTGPVTEVELCYEGTSVGYKSYNIVACAGAWTCNNAFYSKHVDRCKNVFGCVSLTKQDYCILNKAYSPEEYEVLVAKLTEHMKRTGEWGEFFPMQLSPFPYNDTVAQQYFPLEKSDALHLGLTWKDETTTSYNAVKRAPLDPFIDADNIPQQVFECSVTKKPYRITTTELAFYQASGLPLPQICSDERQQRRFAWRKPRHIWTRQCMCTQTAHGHRGLCPDEFSTTYAPERNELVYCERCYQKEVY